MTDSTRTLHTGAPGASRVGALLIAASQVAGGATFVALAAQVSIPLWPVPVTGQTLAVLLTGGMLGVRRGAVAQLLYLAAGVLGAPVFANGESGFAVLASPSAGYLVSFPLAAAAVGAFVGARRFGVLASVMAGNAVIYAVGLSWLAFALARAGLPHGVADVLQGGLFPFVAGDALKLALIVAVLQGRRAWSRRTSRNGQGDTASVP